MNDTKVHDVMARMLRITTKARLTIAECSVIHMRLLTSLAIEAANGDQRKAADLLEQTANQMVGALRAGTLIVSRVASNVPTSTKGVTP